MQNFLPNNVSPWIRFDLSIWQPLIENKKLIKFSKHDIVYRQGQPSGTVFIVAAGRVKVKSTYVNGNEKQTFIADIGGMCGEISCLHREPYISTGVAATDCQLYAVLYTDLEALMRTNHEISVAFCESISRKAAILHFQVLELSFSSSMQRTALNLLYLSSEYGSETPNGIRIPMRFTHEEMACLVNSSRVTISNIFSQLTADGILNKQDGHYYIRNLQKLKDIVVDKTV